MKHSEITGGIYEDLVFVDFEAADATQLIRKLGAELEKKGFVKASYVDAVTAREKEYPTGLQLEDLGIAMPHTSGEHVIVPAIAIAKLKEAVVFGHMGDDETKVSAEIIFMMAIQDPAAQIEWLKNVMQIFTNKSIMSELAAANDKDTLFAVIQKYL